MLSIQEMLDKTVEQRKTLEAFMDSHAYFDPSEASVFHGQKKSITRELYDSFKKISLAEFLSKANTTVGAQYLAPDFVAAKIYSGLQSRDIVPLISADIITPKSDTVDVPIGLQTAYIGSPVGKATSTMNTDQATLTLQTITADIAVTNEMLEDNQYGLIEWQIQEATRALSGKAANLALTVLKTATDGRGTTIALAAGSDTTTPAQVGSAIGVVSSGAQSLNYPGFKADTMVMTTEAWGDAFSVTAGNIVYPPQVAGYDAWCMGLNIVFCNDSALHGGFNSNRMINCISPVFSKDYALLTARKSFGRIENYSKPVEDLAGAILTGRQDSVTLNNDAICALTES